ncbi:MAG: TPMT family class I SAM-dependent methyltransferase [Chitinophagales bacterium]|nr:TPMT family class I SAM-dependent methyltransferase [Chitinophagales bacterium]MCZ2394291.1 TPMT family class I SAM-dependent methyltransferase [Chitinophagales bacterium]
MQEKIELNQDFWNGLWKNSLTGWDIGAASPPISEFMNQYPDKDAKILIPGCGNAYEADFLVSNGFTNITLIDIAPIAAENLKNKFLNTPQIHVICGDFYQLEDQYDIIIEQTFFCTFYPEDRRNYASKAASLLKENGEIIGVLFDREFGNSHPPFGGNKADYIQIFSEYFDIIKIEKCYNSISPRANSELFIRLRKK